MTELWTIRTSCTEANLARPPPARTTVARWVCRAGEGQRQSLKAVNFSWKSPEYCTYARSALQMETHSCPIWKDQFFHDMITRAQQDFGDAGAAVVACSGLQSPVDAAT